MQDGGEERRVLALRESGGGHTKKRVAQAKGGRQRGLP